jgi:hypothetical protein
MVRHYAAPDTTVRTRAHFVDSALPVLHPTELDWANVRISGFGGASGGYLSNSLRQGRSGGTL